MYFRLVIWQLIWPCDMDASITPLVSHIASLCFCTVITRRFCLKSLTKFKSIIVKLQV